MILISKKVIGVLLLDLVQLTLLHKDLHIHYQILRLGQPNTVTVSGLGGVESIPSTVTVDFGFGETEVVSAPTFSQLGLQGYVKNHLEWMLEEGVITKM